MDLLPGQRGQLGVEAAEADDLDVPVRVPTLLLGEHAREDPGGRAGARDADRLALEVRDAAHLGGDVEREVVALGVGRHGLDGRARLAEHEDVGRARHADEHLARHDRLEQVGAAAEGDELGGEPLVLEEALLERDDDRPGHRVVAEHRRADLHGALGAGDPRGDRGERGRGGEEPTTCQRGAGHGRSP